MNSHAEIHRDDLTSKTGMWLFLFTEMLLFGGLFVVYSVYRFRNPVAFHLAAGELSVFIGTLNTVILLTSSATIAMSVTAMQKHNKKLTLLLLGITILLGIAFLVNKYFEWGGHIRNIYIRVHPFLLFVAREMFFFMVYITFMTGLHALHIIIGLVFIGFITVFVVRDKVNPENFVLLENSGLYWHLVDLIWIFLFPLFYLIT